jgi:uncharacterized membrane protein
MNHILYLRNINYLRLFFTIIGLFITIYLAYVHLSASAELSCGNIGDCTKVQASIYGFILGIPVSYLGLSLYLCIFALIIFEFYVQDYLYKYFIQLLNASIVSSALIFSMYLTWVEFFILKEICIWCIGNAFVIFLIFLFNIWTLVSLKRYRINK